MGRKNERKVAFTFLTLFCLSVEAFLSHANDLGRVHFFKQNVHFCMKTRNNNVYQRLGMERKFCIRSRTQINVNIKKETLPQS